LALLGGVSLLSAGPAAGQDGRNYLPLIVSPGAATPSPEPGEEVTARNFSGYYDLGDYMLFGEVTNNLGVPIYDVELSIIYRDAAGNILATDEAAPSLVRIEPGSTAPVFDPHFGAPAGIAQYTITVENWSRTSLVDYRPLTILSTEKQNGVLGVTVSGQGRNDAGQPLANIMLVASFRDSSGKVVDVQYDYPIIGALQPGQTFDYTIETMDDTLAGDSVLVQGQGSIEP
jgi:hypothetical protein